MLKLSWLTSELIKKQHIDGKVPVAECIHNILKPLLCGSGSCSSPAKVKAATMPPTEDSPSQKRPRRLKWGNHVLAVEEGSGDADSAEVQERMTDEALKPRSVPMSWATAHAGSAAWWAVGCRLYRDISHQCCQSLALPHLRSSRCEL